MILLDASIIIDALRAKDVAFLAQMKSADGAVCGVTRAEILGGACSPQDRLSLLTILDGFKQVAIPQAMWDDIGNIRAELRANGITVPLADVVLSAVAISLDIEVWARDADFLNMQKVLTTLKLYRENP